MRREHDELFAKTAIQSKSLTPAQIMGCRDVLAELESAGVTKLLAAVAVDQGVLSREAAEKIVASINQKAPGKHPPLPAAARMEEAPAPAKPARRAPAPAAPAARPAPALRSQPPKGEGGRTSRPAPAAPRPKSNAKLFVILGAAAAVLAVAVVAIAMSGGSSKERP